MAAVSGTAASIRAATDSETFDLAGHDAANIGNTIRDAFSEPFHHLDHMIRITFVVGAGKLSRQKYDDKAMLSLTSTLRQLDYVEDRGASCVDECAGCYKTQHDTGKNLFTVVVFPRLAGRENDDDGRAGAASSSSSSSPSEYPIPIPLAEGTPVHAILMASEDAFAKMVPSMCPSWSEKKMCSEVLNLAVETIRAIDDKLISGTPLTDIENSFYDATGGVDSVSTKVECVRKLMHEQVERGNMTRRELDRLLHQVEERIVSLDEDIDSALRNAREGDAGRLSSQKEKAESRKRMLEGREARSSHPLKHEARITTLRAQLRPLLKMERETRGKLLSIKETKELAAKDELLEEISELEGASRGWFEEDDAFEARLRDSRDRRSAAASNPSSGKAAPGGKGKKKPGTGMRSTGDVAWLTPGGLAAKQTALGKKASAASKSKPKSGGGVFAAMMIDSDSDSD